MTRLLVLPALAALAALAPVPSAYADHLCIYSHGRPIACAPHPEEWISHEQICVTSGGRPIVCV